MRKRRVSPAPPMHDMAVIQEAMSPFQPETLTRQLCTLNEVLSAMGIFIYAPGTPHMHITHDAHKDTYSVYCGKEAPEAIYRDLISAVGAALTRIVCIMDKTWPKLG